MMAIPVKLGQLFGHRSSTAKSSIVDGQLVQTTLPQTEELAVNAVLHQALEKIAEITPLLDTTALKLADLLCNKTDGLVAAILSDLQALADPALPRTPRNGVLEDLQEHAALVREQNAKIHAHCLRADQFDCSDATANNQLICSSSLISQEVACLESEAVRADNNCMIDDSEQLPVLLHPQFTMGEVLDADELFAELPASVRSSLMAMLTSGLIRTHQRAHDKILRSTFRAPQLTRALVYAALQSHAAVSAIQLLGQIAASSELVISVLCELRDYPKIQAHVRSASEQALIAIGFGADKDTKDAA